MIDGCADLQRFVLGESDLASELPDPAALHLAGVCADPLGLHSPKLDE